MTPSIWLTPKQAAGHLRDTKTPFDGWGGWARWTADHVRQRAQQMDGEKRRGRWFIPAHGLDRYRLQLNASEAKAALRAKWCKPLQKALMMRGIEAMNDEEGWVRFSDDEIEEIKAVLRTLEVRWDVWAENGQQELYARLLGKPSMTLVGDVE